MHPTLFSLGGKLGTASFGPITISSFGFFLSLAFLSAVFIAWRLAKTYDLNEEKILDLAILTFFGGMIGARIYFILLNFKLFENIERVFLINRYPGLGIWGGIIGGALTLWFFCKRAKLNIWQVADFAAVGLFLGLTFGNLGCLLGGCNFGAVSNSPIAVSVVGLVGKRLPLPAFEGILSLIIFAYLWKQVIRFHFFGKIAAVSLMILGVVKLLSEFYRDSNQYLPYLGGFTAGYLFSILSFISGFFIFYYRSKRSLADDLDFLFSLPKSEKKRQLVLSKLKKSWYNYQVLFKIKVAQFTKFLNSLPKVIKRRFNVKSTPKDIIEN